MTDPSRGLLGATRPQNDDSGSLRYGRRGFLRAAGGVAVAGLLAGCTSAGSGGNTGADTGGDGSGENSGTNDANEGGSIEEWLADTGNYDSVEDMTGKNSVTVEVGAEGNNGVNAFAPAAIEISPGTTVTWEWINGYHNVVDENGQFSSGEPEQNATFEHTFDTAGTILYYCEPHRSMGMKGAIIVAGGDSETVGNTSNQEE